MLLLAGALFAMFFFLTVFVQSILHYSPLKTGFIYLPLSAAIVVSAQVCAKQLVKVGPKPFLVVGAVMVAVALWWLSLVNVHSTYAANLLGPLIIFGLGMGFMFVPLTMIAVSGVEPEEAGSASGLLNVTQQVGGSLGLAILTTAFATAQRHAPHGASANVKLAHGISTALQVSVVFGVAAMLASFFLITAKASDLDPSAMPGMGG
jgi:MFS family permease